jgi:hypothetical protein
MYLMYQIHVHIREHARTHLRSASPFYLLRVLLVHVLQVLLFAWCVPRTEGEKEKKKKKEEEEG